VIIERKTADRAEKRVRYNGDTVNRGRKSEVIMQTTFEVQQRIHSLLAQLPVPALESLLVRLETMVPPAEGAPQETTDRDVTPYDFSDLTGRLAWKGDAVGVQQALRNEW
jgi:hypothetical protein